MGFVWLLSKMNHVYVLGKAAGRLQAEIAFTHLLPSALPSEPPACISLSKRPKPVCLHSMPWQATDKGCLTLQSCLESPPCMQTAQMFSWDPVAHRPSI